MGAPSLTDGIRRTLEEIAVPSVVILAVVIGLKQAYGPQEAGIAFLGLSALPLIGIYLSAKYWNSKYTLGFVIVGLLFWASLPSIGQWLVPPIYVQAAQILELLFLLGVGWMLTSKIGLI